MGVRFRGWKLLFLLCLANSVAYIAVFELPPIIGDLVRDFHITYAQAGLFMSVYALVRMIGSLLAGAFSDRYGVKYFVLSGLALLAGAGFWCASTATFVPMLAGRTLIGIGATCIFIPGLAASMSLLGPKKVNLATGTFFTSMNLGLAIALLVTPILAAEISWRMPLNLFAVVAVAVGIAFATLTWGISLKQQPAHAEAINPEKESIALGTYSVRNIPLLLVSAGYFLMLFQAYGMITWLPEYLRSRNYTPAAVGTVSMLLGLILIPASFVAGWLGDRLGAWLIAVLGATLCGTCPAILILAPRLNLIGVFLDVFILAVGTGFLVVPLTSILTYLVPRKDSGKAVGLVHTTGYAGSILSTYLGGYLLTTFGTFTWPFLLFAGCMVLGLVILMFLRSAYSSARATVEARVMELPGLGSDLTQQKAG